MSVYVDDAVTLWRGKRWAHLMADTLDELHAMAARVGMPRRAFQDKRSGMPTRAAIACSSSSVSAIRWAQRFPRQSVTASST